MSHLPVHRPPPLLLPLVKLGVPSRQRFCAVPGTWDSAPVSFADVSFAIPVIFLVAMKCIAALVTTLHQWPHLLASDNGSLVPLGHRPRGRLTC